MHTWAVGCKQAHGVLVCGLAALGGGWPDLGAQPGGVSDLRWDRWLPSTGISITPHPHCPGLWAHCPQMALACCPVIFLRVSAVSGTIVGHLRPLPLGRDQSMETIGC